MLLLYYIIFLLYIYNYITNKTAHEDVEIEFWGIGYPIRYLITQLKPSIGCQLKGLIRYFAI